MISLGGRNRYGSFSGNFHALNHLLLREDQVEKVEVVPKFSRQLHALGNDYVMGYLLVDEIFIKPHAAHIEDDPLVE